MRSHHNQILFFTHCSVLLTCICICPYLRFPGTSSIVDEKTRDPLLSTLSLIVETAHKLRQDGHRVIIVSSGAIGVGLRRMDVGRRPKHLSKLQVRTLRFSSYHPTPPS